jgi:3-methyladenine DNA glycosylase AlkC
MSTNGEDIQKSEETPSWASSPQAVKAAISPRGKSSSDSPAHRENQEKVPKVSDHQDVMDSLWPVMMKEVESKMIFMEQELIKRHNIKMMNEMQEVVRQIKQAKTKNDETLRDYQKKQTDLTRSVLEIAEKYASMRSELDELKRQVAFNKQQLMNRCDQTTDQVSQLKHAVFTAWQKEKAEIQQKVSQSYRGDLALVLGQFDAKLKDNFSETSKLRYEIKRLTAKMNGEDPDSVPFEMPSYVDTAVAAVSRLPAVEVPTTSVEQESISSPAVTSAGPPPGLTTQQSPLSSANTASAAAAAGVNLSSLTQNLAAFIARQQGGSSSGGPPQVNVAMLQQFMQTLPRQQQLQLQMLLQQHRAQQAAGSTSGSTPPSTTPPPPAQPAAPTVSTPTTPLVPPGLGISSTSAPSAQPLAASAPATGTPAATMIQSLAQQLQMQVNAAQQKASTAPAGTVTCPFFAMFGWCKFGERCRYMHQPTGKEPLRNLPQSVIQTLQTQLASGSTAETTQTLMTALAGIAARQNSATPGPASTLPPPPGLSAPGGTAANSVQQAMIQAQIQAQQEAAQMGSAKAKTMPCRFFSIGRCAYGDRCAYSHANGGAAPSGKDTSSQVAAAALSAWGKTDLSQASWGAPTPQQGSRGSSGEEETGLIMDGEDDTNYDQWNAMTFDEGNGAPPGL